jgi:uncharacterized membrane protein (UPF0127 family)
MSRPPRRAVRRTRARSSVTRGFRPPQLAHLRALGLAALGAVTLIPGAGPPHLLASAKQVTSSHHALLVVGHRDYQLSVATTPAQQALGLGHRPRLPPSSGMLFVFHTSATECFWMKGMRFALDIIWLSPSGKVVSVERDLLPTSYPSAFCAVAQDVIELDAGQAKAAGISIGRVVRLEMPA